MNFRKLLSLTLLISLVPLLLTSVVLYIVPEGRVAYWSDWKMLGLSKSQWGDIHINLGWLFLAAGLLHLYLNWKVVVSYLKNRAKALKIVSPEFTLGTLLTLFVVAGTLLGIPPLSTILDFGTSFKEAAALKYGEPPYGHAERSSLSSLARRTGLDIEKVEQELALAKVKFTGREQTVLDIAKMNDLTPKAVWEVAKKAKPEVIEGSAEPFPDAPFPGFGRLKLSEVCNRYQLDSAAVVQALSHKGLNIDSKKSLKEIATENNTEPHQLFEVLREVVLALKK